MNKKAILRSLQSERLAVSMRHRNIVTIYHVNDRSDPAFVIMEYVGKRTSDGMYIYRPGPFVLPCWITLIRMTTLF